MHNQDANDLIIYSVGVLVLAIAYGRFSTCSTNMNRSLQDSYILFVKVVNAEEPCASTISDLVGI